MSLFKNLITIPIITTTLSSQIISFNSVINTDPISSNQSVNISEIAPTPTLQNQEINANAIDEL
jgi:hypothetical protein